MANKLRPFRDYSEHDVVNLFAHIDDVVDDGTVVKLNTNVNWDVNGWRNTDGNEEGSSMLGSVGAAYNNTVSQRYGVFSRIENCGTADTDVPLGMTLYGVAEFDENGEKLIYNPRKAAEMQVSVSGQAVPVVAKGIFLFNYGTASSSIVGYNARVGSNGTIVTGGVGKVIGKWLGNSDSEGYALLRLDVHSNSTGKF